VRDKYDNDVLAASVVLVDEEQLILKDRKNSGKFYRLRCGQFLGEAVESPLSLNEVWALGIPPHEEEALDEE
jgi:hypothetical protein